MKLLTKEKLKKGAAMTMALLMLSTMPVSAEELTEVDNTFEELTEVDNTSEELTEVDNTSEEMTEILEENEADELLMEAMPVIKYKGHVQNIGWQDYKSDGEICGTEGQAKRLEAIQIHLENQDYDGDISYRAHVQTYGWLDWVNDDSVTGTQGESKRIEALQIKLTGEMSKHYDIYYRVHCQSYGWLGWAKNGQTSGTTGYGKRIEAIQIVLTVKNAEAPGSIQNASHTINNIAYCTHIQTYGWEDTVYSGKMSGTTGLAKRLEGIKIKISADEYSGGVTYRTHVQTYGWQEYVSDGQMSGTEGQSKRLEGICIKLTGEMAEHYDVYYRVHCQSYGWMDWKKNGDMAGTEGESKRLEAIQIFLAEKNEDVVYPKAETSQKVRVLDPSKPMVALTYDDGPAGSYTNRILDSLEQCGGKATFFVVGNRVPSNAAVVKRASDMGCQIANHTYSHPSNFAGMGATGISTQISQCDAAVRNVTGKTPTMMRPVGGGVSATLKSTCDKPMINWSIDTLDWKYRDANRVYSTVVNNVHDGDIILMHDIHPTTIAASERIIPELTRRGYQLVTVEELAYYKGKNLTAHNVYNSCK